MRGRHAHVSLESVNMSNMSCYEVLTLRLHAFSLSDLAWHQALQLLSDMRQEALVPDTILFNALISTCSKATAWEQVLTLVQQPMRLDAIACNAAIAACGAARDWRCLDILLKIIVS